MFIAMSAAVASDGLFVATPTIAMAAAASPPSLRIARLRGRISCCCWPLKGSRALLRSSSSLARTRAAALACAATTAWAVGAFAFVAPTRCCPGMFLVRATDAAACVVVFLGTLSPAATAAPPAAPPRSHLVPRTIRPLLADMTDASCAEVVAVAAAGLPPSLWRRSLLPLPGRSSETPFDAGRGRCWCWCCDVNGNGEAILGGAGGDGGGMGPRREKMARSRIWPLSIASSGHTPTALPCSTMAS